MIPSAIVMIAVFGADPNEKQIELLKTFRSEFVEVTPGTGKFPKSYKMGRSSGGLDAERPVREITITYSYHIARYELPQDLWEAVMGSNPSRWKGPRNSVEMLSFQEATQFCQKATALMRTAKLIGDDEEIRLPSEAEWEYAARAGTDTVYSFGDDVTRIDDFAWHTGNAAGNDPPVGAKKPNNWQLYDVHGYLWEWCSDTWHDNYNDAPTDGSARTGGDATRRVLRSGSWKDKAEKLTSTYRIGRPAETQDDAVGLRCVLARAR